MERTKPGLWKRIVEKWKASAKGGKAGQWNARKAQLAVQEYKQKGGSYKGEKSQKNSLVRWTKEKWGYVSGNKEGRYLPKKVREHLTQEEKKTTNTNKKKGTKAGKQYVPWEESVKKKFRKWR